jgi:hypothetical protein
MKKASTPTTKGTPEQIAEWQAKYGTGNIIELHSDDKFCYIFTPSIDLQKWKQAVAARKKSVGHLVDAVLNNCWIAGDESFKTDEAIKLDIEDQVDELIDIPESEIETLDNGNFLIKVGAVTCEVRKATRMDIRYAEDRNRDSKPLDTQIFLLERIAVNDLKEIRSNVKVYVSILFAISEIRDKKRVELKKF